MFIYYNKNSAYQSLIYSSIKFIPADTYTNTNTIINTIIISQTDLPIPLTGQLIFTYDGLEPAAQINSPFIVATGVTISSFSATGTGTGTITVTIGVTYASVITDSLNFGFSFALVYAFYFANASNISITKLENIPLTKLGAHFFGLGTKFGSIVPGQNPIIRTETSLVQCFRECTNFNSNISGWDTSNVTDMREMFNTASSFNNGFSAGIGNTLAWNTSLVISLESCFQNCTNFNSDISGWNTSKVATMFNMFNNTSKFNQYIGNWNTSSVANMSNMFVNAVVFNNGETTNTGSNPLNWNTSSVTTMLGMFNNTPKFNQYIGNWDTSKVTTMSNMFINASIFNQNIGNWDTYIVTNINSIFQATTLFNNGDVLYGTNKPMTGWAFNALISYTSWRSGSALTFENASTALKNIFNS
jgi:surface protein